MPAAAQAGDDGESPIDGEEIPPVDLDEIRSDIATVSEKVPWIGEAWRWYDIPYRLCHLLLTGWRRRLFGWRARQFINRWSNFFIPFNEVERERAEPLDSWMHNLLVPTNEHVRQGGIWVIEIFPPSRYSQLRKALRQNGWDRNDVFRHQDGSNAQRLDDARTGRGWNWWRLGEVTDPDAGFAGFGQSIRERLPREFSTIDVRAMQVGSSLTMVSAYFRPSDFGRDCIDEVWHATHEPTLTMRGLHRPHVEGRHFAAIRSGQVGRQRLHDLARDWLAERCPGVFAEAQGRHPVVDLMLFEGFDPAAEAPPRDLRESLRALGLDHLTLALYQSPQLPGLVFVPSTEKARDYNVLSNCWTVIGQGGRVIDLNEPKGYGEPPYSPQTLAHMFDDELRAFSQYIAVDRYLDILRATYARARDAALTRHGRFSSRRLLQLRRELLTTGLDLSTAGRDTAEIWSAEWRSFAGVQIICSEPNGLPDSFRPREDFDFIEHLGQMSKTRLKALRADDTAYRDALVTAAALGSSVEASRMGRRALLIAAVSLAVAAATLVVANTSTNTLWSELVGWLRQ